MVRIEKLEMQGFKSFSKKTLITFPTNFSVVCGPNGSGKSNILDAICFVLGRTSAKSLRAGRMLEMIFHGGRGKKPAEAAKVTLHFDNSEKVFPVEDETLILSRRVNVNGVSIYKINGRTVTREKVQEVLRKAHIQPNGHNIILQGDVTDIIERSPMGRREILDEISGIQEFEEKRNKSQRELTTVEERLKESSIILNEKDRNLKKLNKEKRFAQEYEKLTKELDKLRSSRASIKLKEAESAMKKLDDRISRADVNKVDEELNELDNKIEELDKESDNIGERLFDRTKDIAIIKEVERLKSDINFKKDKTKTNRLEIERIGNLIKRLEFLRKREMEKTISRAVKEILNLSKEGVFGTIASLSKVPKEYQTAIEVTAGRHLNDLVVSNENVAIESVNYLKKNRIGRATFLPLDKIKGRRFLQKDILKKDGVIGVALDLIDFDKKYSNAFSFIFGSTVIIKNIDVAKKIGIGKARFVTLDGDIIERYGAIIGGFYKKERKIFGEDESKKYLDIKKNLENEINDLEKHIIGLTKRLEELTLKEEKGGEKLNQLRKKKGDMENRIDRMKLKRKRIFERKVSAQDIINNLRIKKARLEAELENIKLEFENYKKTETYRLPLETLRSRISMTMNAIKSLGAINMKALEEFKQEKIIFDDLREKVDKLAEERYKVLEMIAEVEGRRKTVFEKTLEGIREQFRIVFKDLTGGQADIKLEGDTLEGGLLIEASPGGKKLLNIDAMSGGEKTLTALAFLFAIQRYRPAPFYILDEIDAALDKPNTKKTVELIKKYCDNAQFIVITHNDATIKEADCVYGVSMDNGESRLVGIRMPS